MFILAMLYWKRQHMLVQHLEKKYAQNMFGICNEYVSKAINKY